MKLKIKYLRGGEADEWTSNEEHILHRWDMIALILAGLITLTALIVSRTGHAPLSGSEPAGFVIWFLTCCSYPMLGVIGIVNWIMGAPESRVIRFLTLDHPAPGLWILDFLTVLVIWGCGRLCGLRRDVVPRLKIAGNFLLILIGWGVFQLLLFGIGAVWQNGGVSLPAPPAVSASDSGNR